MSADDQVESPSRKPPDPASFRSGADNEVARIRAEKTAHARTVVERYAALDDVVGIYYGGSLYAGLGNGRSDVDVFIICRGEEVPEDPEQSIVDGQRVDIEFRSTQWLERITHLADELETTTRSYGQIFLPKKELDGAVRLLHSEDAFEEKSVSDARKHLASRVDVLRQILILRSAFDCGNLLEDLMGVFESGDSLSSSLHSRQLLLTGLQCYLAGCGDLYIGPKWTWPKLERSAGPFFPFTRVQTLLGEDGASSSARMQIVQQRIQFTQLLLVAALVNGWDTPRAADWAVWEYSQREGPYRSELWSPLRVRDGLVLTHVDQRTIGLSLEGLTLWGLSTGRERSTTVKQMLVRLPEGPPGLESEVEDYLDQLIAKGAVEVPG